MELYFFRCGWLRILPLICLFLNIQAAQADIVMGQVVDSETKEPLPEAAVKLTVNIYGAVMSMTDKTDSLGMFYLHADRRCTIEASMLGYYSKTKTVLAFSNSHKDTLDIGTIELKMSPQMLKMVEVTAHAKRFTVKGDTIVFHPEAFHLQEGARLEELISKLPGVMVDDQGHMSWNGKPIRLTMDGESMLGGDQLIKQLPAEAVQDIKAYNKTSELSERTGKDDGSEDMVLDLTIKPGFLDRWYGDVMVGYQTPKYYEGELTMNRLSKTDPVMVFANANNIDRRIRKHMNGWSGSRGRGYGQEQGAVAGYQHKWNKREGTQEMNSQYSLTGGVSHDDSWNTSHKETENYLTNTAVTRSSSETYERNHKLMPRLNADVRWAIDTLNTFSIRATVEHCNKRSHSRQTMEQEEKNMSGYLPTPFPDVPSSTQILSQIVGSRDDGRETELNATTGWEHYIKDGSLGASLELNYTDEKNNRWTNRTVTSHTASIVSSSINQSSTSPSTRFNAEAEAHHTRWLAKIWMVQMQYSYLYDQHNNDRYFMTDGLADAANSYYDHYTNNSHHVRLASTINLAPFQIMPDVTAEWQRESQEYQRGMLDTTAIRHRFHIQPSLRTTWKLSKTMGLELNYGFNTSQPRILQTIGYRDITNPLFINEGNPGLKNKHSHDFRLAYNMVLARSQTTLSTSIGYRINDRNSVTAFSYNPLTAVYVSRPENVKGSKTWEFSLNFDRAIGELFRLGNDFRLMSERHYGYLTQLPTETERKLNCQTDLHPRNKLTLSLDNNWLKASLFANIEANRLRYSASPEQNTTLWMNDFGMNAEATVGNFVFVTDLTETTRRGYAAPSMNRDMLLWNASVTWKVVKGKARLKLEMDDILNQQDNIYSFQSAYQRTTSWKDFRHHSVTLNFTYHL